VTFTAEYDTATLTADTFKLEYRDQGGSWTAVAGTFSQLAPEKFRFLPGQTEFTMGVETEIDGKRCFFTADNWFHQDQFSGSGGWSIASLRPDRIETTFVAQGVPAWLAAIERTSAPATGGP